VGRRCHDIKMRRGQGREAWALLLCQPLRYVPSLGRIVSCPATSFQVIKVTSRSATQQQQLWVEKNICGIPVQKTHAMLGTHHDLIGLLRINKISLRFRKTVLHPSCSSQLRSCKPHVLTCSPSNAQGTEWCSLGRGERRVDHGESFHRRTEYSWHWRSHGVATPTCLTPYP
jgi:hypothetical protein